MKVVVAAAAVVSTALAFTVGTATGHRAPERHARPISPPVTGVHSRRTVKSASRGMPTNVVNGLIQNYCTDCHNVGVLAGNLSLEKYDVDSASQQVATSEKMIRKLRAQIMPQAGAPRPTGDTLDMLAESIELAIDKAARPNPGTRTFQRLNRPEYEAAVRDLLGIEVNAGDYLPLDTKSANFDNIADVQSLSPTLLNSYLTAAASVARMAVGNPNAGGEMATYGVSPFASQHPWDHVEGTPYGTRGGLVAPHVFPADGNYVFRVNVSGGIGTRLEDIDISVNGARVALLHYERGTDRNLASADAPVGADYVRTIPIFVKAGQHKVSAAFVKRFEGPYEDLIKPHDWSKASNGNASAGTTEPPHVMELAVIGPEKVVGISETPSRRIIFSCHPATAALQKACAEKIITRLGTRAYRRPLTAHDREGLMGFYTTGAAAGGFEEGIRSALQAMLASPYFVFRFESQPAAAVAVQDLPVSD
jgi:hypothetical protein